MSTFLSIGSRQGTLPSKFLMQFVNKIGNNKVTNYIGIMSQKIRGNENGLFMCFDWRIPADLNANRLALDSKR